MAFSVYVTAYNIVEYSMFIVERNGYVSVVLHTKYGNICKFNKGTDCCCCERTYNRTYLFDTFIHTCIIGNGPLDSKCLLRLLVLLLLVTFYLSTSTLICALLKMSPSKEGFIHNHITWRSGFVIAKVKKYNR